MGRHSWIDPDDEQVIDWRLPMPDGDTQALPEWPLYRDLLPTREYPEYRRPAPLVRPFILAWFRRSR